MHALRSLLSSHVCAGSCAAAVQGGASPGEVPFCGGGMGGAPDEGSRGFSLQGAEAETPLSSQEPAS